MLVLGRLDHRRKFLKPLRSGGRREVENEHERVARLPLRAWGRGRGEGRRSTAERAQREYRSDMYLIVYHEIVEVVIVLHDHGVPRHRPWFYAVSVEVEHFLSLQRAGGCCAHLNGAVVFFDPWGSMDVHERRDAPNRSVQHRFL